VGLSPFAAPRMLGRRSVGSGPASRSREADTLACAGCVGAGGLEPRSGRRPPSHSLRSWDLQGRTALDLTEMNELTWNPYC
jgi:hypothetical protein